MAIGALSNNKALTWVLIRVYLSESITISFCSRMAIYITKILLSASNIAITNSFESISWAYLVINRTLLVIYDFYMRFFSLNNTSILLIFKKNIFGITSNLVLATRKVSWKNLSLPTLFSTQKSAITISKISRAELSIFWALILIF